MREVTSSISCLIMLLQPRRRLKIKTTAIKASNRRSLDEPNQHECKSAVCPEEQIRGRMKVGSASSSAKPLSLWTAPDESWKPWQQAHTQESAKTLAPLKLSSMKRLLAPRFSLTNTTLYTIKTHRETLTVTDVNFRSVH